MNRERDFGKLAGHFWSHHIDEGQVIRFLGDKTDQAEEFIAPMRRPGATSTYVLNRETEGEIKTRFKQFPIELKIAVRNHNGAEDDYQRWIERYRRLVAQAKSAEQNPFLGERAPEIVRESIESFKDELDSLQKFRISTNLLLHPELQAVHEPEH